MEQPSNPPDNADNIAQQPPPRIPLHIMDGVAQRELFAGVFVVMIGVAVYTLYWDPLNDHFTSSHYFWTAVDAAFLLLVWLLNVPRVWFRRRIWLLALFALFTFNWKLSGQQCSLSELKADVVDMLGLSRTLTLRTGTLPETILSVDGESKNNVADILFNSSLILGRHTVHILPQSTVKINPENKCFCLDQSSFEPSVSIPIRLNGTAPWTIEYTLTRFADGTRSHHNLTIPAHTEVEHATGGHHQVQDADICVNEPGAYKIHRASDAAGIDVRVYQRFAIVVNCPSAKFNDQEDTYTPGVSAVPVRPVCVGDHTELPLLAEGFPPLTVSYERRINRDTKDLTVDSIYPDDYDPKSVPFGLTNAAHWREIDKDGEAADWSWGKERSVRVYLNTTFSTAGEVFYKIKRITDACNNTYDYAMTSTSRVASIGTGDRRRFDVFNRPSARFECDASKPIKIQTFAPGNKQKHTESPMASIPLHLQGEAPWDIQYEVIPLPNNREVDFPKNVFGNHSIQIKHHQFSLSIPHPAIVNLLSVKDANCQGSILLPSSCSVLQTLPPTLRLEPAPIREACVGEVGAQITLTLTGEAPWTVFYRQIRADDRTSFNQRVQVDAPRRVLTLMPEITGRYVYEFYQVTDVNYPKGVQVDTKIARYEQVVHPKPGGRWLQAHRAPIKACAGSEVPLDIELAGTGPWKLAWYWDNGNGISQTLVNSELVVRRHTVKVPLLSAGAYTVGLVNVTDANGCTQSLQSEPSVQIDVKENRPTVAFRERGPVMFAEGQEESLPLKLTGNPPWELSWKKRDAKDGVRVQGGVKDPNIVIQVDQPGFYELTSVKDAYCSGTVVEDAEVCEARWITKPSLSVIPEMPPVCEDDDVHFDVLLTGQAPWTVVYEREYTRPVNGPSGKNAPPAREEHKVQTGHPIARVRSYTAIAGDYTYRFKSLSDDIYSKAITLPRSDAYAVRQHVYPRPQAKFANPSKQNVLCVGDELSESGGFTINLLGSAPFEVTFEIRQEGSTRPHTITVPDIRPHDHQYAFRPKNTFIEVGKYTVSIVGVRDAMKCGGKIKNNNGVDDGTKVTVEVSDVAGIAPLTAQSDGKCIGDILAYALQGVPPWHVEYEFNGQRKSVYDILTPKYTQLANNVGNITITKVCHQQPDHCCTRPEGLTNIIHQLPGVVLSGGRDIIEDIREGDKTEIFVDFSGEPPFSFTYTRSEPSKYTSHEHPVHPARGAKSNEGVRVLETHTVSGIQTRQHSIVTSQEGTFEVTSVVDKWCEFPRVAKGVGGASVLPVEKKGR